MSPKKYKRKPGDFELRILPNGQLVMIAPDEAIIKMARSLTEAGMESQSNGQRENTPQDKDGK
ncbi:MAG: hypothetical protein JW860_01350 [Sedimentisphaerales bacterium]|nr:hypothetical protein [Sedimentisphaerales bacterium]